jgi:hypothetical protein
MTVTFPFSTLQSMLRLNFSAFDQLSTDFGIDLKLQYMFLRCQSLFVRYDSLQLSFVPAAQ